MIDLKDARSEAKSILAEYTLGKAHQKHIIFNDAKKLFLEDCEAKNKERTVKSYTRILDQHFGLRRGGAMVFAANAI